MEEKMDDQPHQTNPNDHRYYPEDEIELMDYLLVIWRRKYLIMAGTIVCAVVAFIISITAPKPPNRYRVEMVIEPGVEKIDKNARKVYFESPAKIKGLIEGGVFNNQILNDIRDSENKNLPISLNFKLAIPQNTNILKISYETSNSKEGIKILTFLAEAILNKNRERIGYYKDDYDQKIQFIKRRIAYLDNAEQVVKSNLVNFDKVISEMPSDLQLNMLLSTNSKNAVSSLSKSEKELFKTIQLYDLLKKQNSNIISAELYLARIKNDKKELSIEIEDLEKKKRIFKTSKSVSLPAPPLFL